MKYALLDFFGRILVECITYICLIHTRKYYIEISCFVLKIDTIIHLFSRFDCLGSIC